MYHYMIEKRPSAPFPEGYPPGSDGNRDAEKKDTTFGDSRGDLPSIALGATSPIS